MWRRPLYPSVTRFGAVVLLVLLQAIAFPVGAGHEAPLYPSYYPQEIRIEAVAPATAPSLLETGKIHAYVGAGVPFDEPLPKSVRFVESLGKFLVVRVNPASPALAGGGGACRIAAAVLKGISRNPQGVVVHPYPVTAYHGDYLHHADRADAAKDRFAAGPDIADLKVRMGPRGAESAAAWDASIEEIDAGELVAGERFGVNGWLGPPWLKAGWFHAYLLLGPALDAPARERAGAQLQRLQTDSFETPHARINAERALVAELTESCRTLVAGYARKREYYSAQYSDGIENIAWDSHAGLNAPIFIRTAKLKDFPWNGWLRLGVPAPPAAAWNPFGGFTDDAGRLIWSAIGDPALFPEPRGSGWTVNRIGDVRAGDR